MPAWLGKGDQSPPSALLGRGSYRRAETHRGERVLHKLRASLSFPGDPRGGSFPFPTPLHPSAVHLVCYCANPIRRVLREDPRHLVTAIAPQLYSPSNQCCSQSLKLNAEG